MHNVSNIITADVLYGVWVFLLEINCVSNYPLCCKDKVISQSVIILEIAVLLEWVWYCTSRLCNWLIDADFGATWTVPLQKIWKPTNWEK